MKRRPDLHPGRPGPRCVAGPLCAGAAARCGFHDRAQPVASMLPNLEPVGRAFGGMAERAAGRARRGGFPPAGGWRAYGSVHDAGQRAPRPRQRSRRSDAARGGTGPPRRGPIAEVRISSWRTAHAGAGSSASAANRSRQREWTGRGERAVDAGATSSATPLLADRLARPSATACPRARGQDGEIWQPGPAVKHSSRPGCQEHARIELGGVV